MKTITIYSTTTCGFCKALKAFLDEKKIEYEDYLVDQDPSKAEEMQKISGSMSVPVIVFNKGKDDQEVQIGFDQQEVEKTLDI